MEKQEILNSLLQINKRTGEIKTVGLPTYRGQFLYNVYGSYSVRKESAYRYCLDLLNSISESVISFGITSANCFKFTFKAVFVTGGITYVLTCTSDYDKVNLLKEVE